MQHNPLSLAIIASLLSFTTSAGATTNPVSEASGKKDILTLDPLVVTATRTPQKTTDIIAQTQVIDAQTLNNYRDKTVIEVLRDQAGFTVKQDGGLGANSNFYLRGYDNSSILVLIDGVKYKSESIGQPALNLLSVAQIERIEVLKGASGSSIYGSDAVGGVIQIFTKGTLSSSDNTSLSVGYGSNNHYKVALSAEQSSDKGNMSIGLSHSKTDGINRKIIDNTDNNDLDGFTLNAANITLNRQIVNNLKTGVSALYNESETEFDGLTADAVGKQKNGAANIFLEHATALAKTRLSYGFSVDDYEDNSPFAVRTVQHHSRLSNRIQLGKNSNLVFGAENLQQLVSPKDNFVINNRKINSAFLGYQFAGEMVDLQANYRIDDNSEYGKQGTYNFGFASSPVKSWRVGANYSTGFRAPSFYDLASNAELKPETSENTEAFMESANDLQRTRVTVYQNTVTNKLASDSDWKRFNYDAAEVTGVSVTSDWKLKNIVAGLAYDRQESEILTDLSNAENQGNRLVYLPEQSALAYIGYAAADYDFRVEHQYVGSRFTDTANTDKLAGYRLINFSGSYYLTPSIVSKLRVTNLADTNYESNKGYNTEGRTYFASLDFDY